MSYQKKCSYPGCKKYFPNAKGRGLCEEHRPKKIMSNNLKGINKHTKKLVVPLSDLDKYQMACSIQYEKNVLLKELFELKSQVKSLAQKINVKEEQLNKVLLR